MGSCSAYLGCVIPTLLRVDKESTLRKPGDRALLDGEWVLILTPELTSNSATDCSTARCPGPRASTTLRSASSGEPFR